MEERAFSLVIDRTKTTIYVLLIALKKFPLSSNNSHMEERTFSLVIAQKKTTIYVLLINHFQKMQKRKKGTFFKDGKTLFF